MSELFGSKKDKLKGQGGEMTFETGSMTREELEAMLNTLPVDITFVDKEDTVRYFSQPKERLGRVLDRCQGQEGIH